MKKALNIIGIALAVAGAFVAISVADGSAYELGIRLAGVVAFAIGTLTAHLTERRPS